MSGCAIIDLYDSSIASGRHRQKHQADLAVRAVKKALSLRGRFEWI